MEALWRNPELLRHIRADLRPARMTAAAGVAVLLCILIVLLFYYAGGEPRSSTRELNAGIYVAIVSLQALALCLWCLSSCSQAIASERVLKTFDFLRTTRLTSWELLFGIIFGAPVTAYFVVVCTLPLSLIFGLAAGISVVAIAATYLMLLVVAVVLSLIALTISLMTDRPRAGEIILLLFLIGWPAAAVMIGTGSDSRFPGLTAIAVVFGLLPLYHVTPPNISGPGSRPLVEVPLFGVQVPSLLVSIILYASAAAWLLLMLSRNLKKDQEDIRLLSRWQAVGFTVYVNVLVFALLDPSPRYAGDRVAASDVAAGYLGLNFLILYAVGLATLTPAPRLKSWWRRSAQDLRSYWSADGLPWPWMVASASAAFLLFVLEAVTSRKFIPFSDWPILTVAGCLGVLLVFAVRDVLFLQWFALRGIQRPVTKGALLLLLYYFTAATLAALFFHGGSAWLTPIGAFVRDPELGITPIAIATGIVLQIAAIVCLLLAIRARLTPHRSPA